MKMIIAINKKRIIGRGNTLPWRSPEDLKHFKAMTMGCTCLVGRKTFEALPPLKGRTLVVLGSGEGQYKSIDEAMSAHKIDWVIGGKTVYEQTLLLCDELHLSFIDNDSDGDVTAPDFFSYNGEVFTYNFQSIPAQ